MFDPKNKQHLIELRDEITNDPTGRGYAGKGDAEIADLLNEPLGAIRINRQSVPVSDIVKVLANNPADVQALTVQQLLYLQILLAGDDVDPSDAGIVAAFRSLFDGTQTWTDLVAYAKRDGSRAEQLWGAGSSVHHLDIAEARRV